MAEPESSLGDFIRRQRELSAMSMREFARLAGISNPYLSQIERGLRAPSGQVLQAIADTLKVSAETLYEQAGVPAEEAAPSKVIQAIQEDGGLTGRQRQALITVYEAFVATGPRAPRPRRPAQTTEPS
jgi:transcriptional regulator with XRE-family HTH domain